MRIKKYYSLKIFLPLLFVQSAYSDNMTFSRKKRSVVWQNSDYFESIAQNNDYLCGIKKQSSELICFQLFKDGSRLPPNETKMFGQYSKISLGGNYSCAISSNDESLSCWGNKLIEKNTISGQLKPNEPVKVLIDKKFIDIATNTNNAFAIDQDGQLYGWGDNSRGQLANLQGYFKKEEPSQNSNNPMKIQYSDKKFFQVSAGEQFFCAIAKDGVNLNKPYGKLYCAGDNSFGQLGQDDDADEAIGKLTQVGNKNYISFSAGKYHACAITLEKKIECWGSNSFGQLGLDPRSTSKVYLPQIVQSSNPEFNNAEFESVVLSDYSTCALTKDGTAYCFGDNTFGQIGGSPEENSISILNANGNNYRVRFTPQQPFSNWKFKFKQLVSNTQSTCGITKSNNLECWGFFEKNYYKDISIGNQDKCGISQIGNRLFCSSNSEITSTHSNPWNMPISTPWASSLQFKQVSVGTYYVCAVAVQGLNNLYCWTNKKNSNNNFNNFPEQMKNINNHVAKIVVGSDHACFIRSRDSKILCSGNNHFGQLGNGNSQSLNMLQEFSEVQLPDIKFKDIALSKNSTCALSSTNEVYCFGSNLNNELGSKRKLRNNSKNLPNKIPNLKLKSIEAGLNHFCGLNAENNSITCWGDNSYGQTGSSVKTAILPYEVTNTISFKDLSLSQNTTCALDINNKTYCFGSNDTKIISKDLNFYSTEVPVQIQSDKEFKKIKLGQNEACGILNGDNTLYCWGNN